MLEESHFATEFVVLGKNHHFYESVDPKIYCNYVQSKTEGEQGTTCFENRFPVMRAGFPCENVDTENTCFQNRDRVCNVALKKM